MQSRRQILKYDDCSGTAFGIFLEPPDHSGKVILSLYTFCSSSENLVRQMVEKFMKNSMLRKTITPKKTFQAITMQSFFPPKPEAYFYRFTDRSRMCPQL